MGKRHKENYGYGGKSKVYYSEKTSSFDVSRGTKVGRVLRIFRQVDESSSQKINEVVNSLAEEGSIPLVKTAFTKRAFIFDPRLMPRNFNEGFLSGYQLRRVREDVDRRLSDEDGGYGVKLGQLVLRSKDRRTLLLNIDSEELSEERKSVYGILGEQRVKGFTAGAKRKGYRDSPVTISIGRFRQPVSKDSELDIIEAVEAGLDVELPVESYSEVSGRSNDFDFRLGSLVVQAINPGHSS